MDNGPEEFSEPSVPVEDRPTDPAPEDPLLAAVCRLEAKIDKVDGALRGIWEHLQTERGLREELEQRVAALESIPPPYGNGAAAE